jgi:hypothetical protein
MIALGSGRRPQPGVPPVAVWKPAGILNDWMCPGSSAVVPSGYANPARTRTRRNRRGEKSSRR